MTRAGTSCETISSNRALEYIGEVAHLSAQYSPYNALIYVIRPAARDIQAELSPFPIIALSSGKLLNHTPNGKKSTVWGMIQ